MLNYINGGNFPWGQLSLGVIIWWGSFSRRKLSFGAIIRREIVCGAIIQGAIVLRAIIRGAISLEGNSRRAVQESPTPFLSIHSPIYWFFMHCPRNRIFQLTLPSHFLKVTKFSVKISQFKFLVMTEKNTVIYKYFCS